MRMAPSRRMTSPLSMGLATMCATRAPYSVGSPSRLGCGTWAPRDVFASSGRLASRGVLNRARCDGDDPDAVLGEVAGDREGHADDPTLAGGVGGLADLAVERRDARGVDDDPALLADGIVLDHAL